MGSLGGPPLRTALTSRSQPEQHFYRHAFIVWLPRLGGFDLELKGVGAPRLSRHRA